MEVTLDLDNQPCRSSSSTRCVGEHHPIRLGRRPLCLSSSSSLSTCNASIVQYALMQRGQKKKVKTRKTNNYKIRVINFGKWKL